MFWLLCCAERIFLAGPCRPPPGGPSLMTRTPPPPRSAAPAQPPAGPGALTAIGRQSTAAILAGLWDGKQHEPGAAAPFDTPLTRQYLGLGNPDGNSLGDIAKAVLRMVLNPSVQAEADRLSRLDQE